MDELLDVYDVEVLTQRELGKHWRLGQCSLSCAFALAAPLKVAIEASRLFYSKLQSDRWGAHLLPVNDLIGAHKRANSDERDAISRAHKRANSDERDAISTGSDVDNNPTSYRTPRSKKIKILSGELVFSKEPPTGYLANAVNGLVDQDSSLVKLSVKATKSDDTKVNEKQWDIWSVHNF